MVEKKEAEVICRGIYKSFGKAPNEVHALDGVDLVVEKGVLHLLMGPSGSGKTTLISVIAGILTQDSGDCWVLGTNLKELSNGQRAHFRGKNLGFVFQSFNLIPTLTIEENVTIPLILTGERRGEAIAKAKELLDRVGLADKIGKYPRELSGGQQQRVAIARGIVHAPSLVVCDEPTSFLDHITGEKIVELLKEITRSLGVTIIVVTHDPRIVQFADKIDRLEDGKIIL